MQYASLYIKYGVTFLLYGLSPFLSKYYGEIGLSDSQIGILTSVPMIIAMFFVPVLGSMSDRIPRKKYMCAAEFLIMACACFLFRKCSGFLAMLLTVSVFNIFCQAEMPVSSSITLEYCRKIGKPFGPIRMTGSLGYQASAIIVALFLPDTLGSLYPMMGTAALLAAAASLLLPGVEGHQHGREKIPVKELFQDERLRTLYILCAFCMTSDQFYSSFFTKHLGDLGMGNAQVSILTLIGTIMELPFLLIGDRVSRKTTIWNWFRVGMVLSGIRFLTLGLFRDFVPLFLVQLLGFTTMACYGFMPQLYISTVVRKELTGSAQSLLNFASFGVTRLIGSLLGGFLAQWIGIAPMFCINGVIILSGVGLFWKQTGKMNRLEKAGA